MAGKRDRLSGNEAVANALRQINPDVFPMFPITPSTEIPQYFANYVSNVASRCLVNKKGGAGAKKHAERKNGRGRADQRVILSIIRALFGHFAPFPFQNTIKCNIMEVP